MKKGKKSQKNDVQENEIPEMNLDMRYNNKKIPVPESPEKIQKEMNSAKKDLEKLKIL